MQSCTSKDANAEASLLYGKSDVRLMIALFAFLSLFPGKGNQLRTAVTVTGIWQRCNEQRRYGEMHVRRHQERTETSSGIFSKGRTGKGSGVSLHFPLSI